MSVDVETSTQQHVLVALVSLLDGSSIGEVTQQQVADAAKVSARTVRAAMSGLEAAGFVQVISNGRGAPTVGLLAF